jgi:hypothetical protein
MILGPANRSQRLHPEKQRKFSWWHPAWYAVGIFLMRSSWRHISSNVSKRWHNSRVKFVARCITTLWFLVFVIIMIISVVRDVSYQFSRIVLLDVIIFLTILVWWFLIRPFIFERSQKVDVVSNDTQIVNVEPSKRLKMDELHQDKVTQVLVSTISFVFFPAPSH